MAEFNLVSGAQFRDTVQGELRIAMRAGRWIGGSLILAGVWAGLAVSKFWSVSKTFDTVRIGDCRDTVDRQLGQPPSLWLGAFNYVGSCGHFTPADRPTQQCKTEYVYANPFAPILPEYYVIRFGHDGRAMLAYRFVSP